MTHTVRRRDAHAPAPARPRVVVRTAPERDAHRMTRARRRRAHRESTAHKRRVQEKLAQDDDDEDMPVPELLDIRDLQGEIEAAVSP